MTRLTPLLLVSLAGCSVLFNPDNVTRCEAPSAPTYLEAVAGEAPGQLTWTWDSTAGSYETCATTAGIELGCVTVACSDGVCTHVDTGREDGARVVRTVAPIDTCSGPLAVAASSSAAPFDATKPDGWTMENTGGCNATGAVLAGLISVEQTGVGCRSAYFTGDDGWEDVTLELELRISSNTPDIEAGPMVQHTATGHRLRLLARVDAASQLFTSKISERLSGSAGDVEMARGLHFTSNEWQRVRVIVSGRTVSWQQGPLGAEPTEVMRFFTREARAGRVGIGADSAGRFEVQNFRVINRARPLPQSPERVSYFFGEDGGMPGARRIGVAVARAECPALSDCDAGCAPPTGARCGLLSRSGLFIDYTQLAVAPPTGLDPNRDWDVFLRFGLPEDAGTNNNWVLQTQTLTMLERSGAETKAAESTVAGVVLAPNSWHTARLVFPSDGGVVRGELDGQPYTTTTRFPRGNDSRTLNSLHFGNAINASVLYLHELTVTQH